jgi:CBS domain-containing protein
MRVVDLMTSDVITASPETPIKAAARLMVRNKVSGLPVCDEDARVVGIITEADFLRLEVAREEADNLQPVERVEQVMHRAVLTITADATVAEAARMMVVNDVNRLPVTDVEGKSLGIISRLDVVAAFTRPDEIIEDEIREDLLRRVLFVDPDDIIVEVKNGVVTFRGEIGTRNEARLLAELGRRLDGVIKVESELTWRLDDGE